MVEPETSPSVAQRFDSICSIGSGMFGEVYKARDRLTGGFVALKRILMRNMSSNGFPETTIREIKMAQELRHPNIACLREVFYDDKQHDAYLVLDYAEFDLGKLIERTSLSAAQVKSYMRQLLTAVYVCHKHHIYHRDLKPINILVTADNRIQLTDFGLAQKIPAARGAQTYRVITIWYRPLELLLQSRRYGEEVDVWSLGCIFYEMITGRPPVRGMLIPGKDFESEVAQALEIVRICGPPERAWPEVENLPEYKMIANRKKEVAGNLDEFLSRTLPEEFEGAKPLLLKMLHLKPSERCTVRQALEHPFLKNVGGMLDAERLPRLRLPEAHSKTGAVHTEAKKEGQPPKVARPAPPKPAPPN
jgi:serine/threonine protein kinase